MGMFPLGIRTEILDVIITSMTGWAAGNALVFGEYALKAFLDHEPSSILLKLTSFACVTLTFLLHGTAVEWGLRVQNTLGVFKLFVLVMVAATGLVALKNGIPTVAGIQQEDYQWRGRHNFVDMWKGTNVSASSLCLCLYSVCSLLSETVWYELMLFFLPSGYLVLYWIFKCELRHVWNEESQENYQNRRTFGSCRCCCTVYLFKCRIPCWCFKRGNRQFRSFGRLPFDEEYLGWKYWTIRWHGRCTFRFRQRPRYGMLPFEYLSQMMMMMISQFRSPSHKDGSIKNSVKKECYRSANSLVQTNLSMLR